MIIDYDVIIKRLGDFTCCSVQKYFVREGLVRWRSLNVYRSVFRSGYMDRETAAQEIVRDCPVTKARMRGRARILRERYLENNA